MSRGAPRNILRIRVEQINPPEEETLYHAVIETIDGEIYEGKYAHMGIDAVTLGPSASSCLTDMSNMFRRRGFFE